MPTKLEYEERKKAIEIIDDGFKDGKDRLRIVFTVTKVCPSVSRLFIEKRLNDLEAISKQTEVKEEK